MTFAQMISVLIESHNLHQDKEEFEKIYQSLYQRLTHLQELGTKMFMIDPAYTLAVCNQYLPEEDKIEADLVDGKMKFVLSKNPKIYLDTPCKEEEKLERLGLLFQLDYRLALNAQIGNKMKERNSETRIYVIKATDELDKDVKKMN